MFLLKFFKNSKKSKKDIHISDRLFFYFLQSLALLVIVSFLALFSIVFKEALPALKQFGFSFFVNVNWDSWLNDFGALAMIWGTVVSSILALLIAVPVSVGVSLFLNELAPKWLARPLNFGLEMLAAIPSIVYGIWGVFFLAPIIRSPVQEFLGKYFSFLPFFKGPQYGVGMLCAGIILAIMITPTIASICKEVFRSIPYSHREAVLGMGATRWEMFKYALIKGGQTGILGAVIMGLGRALGETMAVTMVIGNKPNLSLSLFEPAQTMASILANQYAEADSALHLSSLTAIALALFLISIIVHSSSLLFAWKTKRKFSIS